jgi:6-phosphofructokinase 1
MVRSCPARGTDAIRCYELARAAVHAAMAGRTDCVVGSVGDSCSLVPIALATIERQKLDTDSQAWRSVLDATGQEFYFNGVARDTFAGDAFAP